MRVVIIDDSFLVLENFLPFLVAYSESAQCILYQDQEEDALAKEVVALHPDIILLDYNLGDQAKTNGALFCKTLRHYYDFYDYIIGFSSGKETRTHFASHQATGFVDKSADEPEIVMAKVAKIVAMERRRSQGWRWSMPASKFCPDGRLFNL